MAMATVLACIAATMPARAGRVERYVSLALQGDLGSAADLFVAAAPDTLTAAEAELGERFQRRFVHRDEAWVDDPRATPLARAVMAVYRGYWTRSLMGELPAAGGEAHLTRELRGVLAAHGHPAAVAEVPDGEVLDRVHRLLEREGLHVLGGVTRPYFDLMLWASQDSTRYEVELTDTVQPVSVVFIGDFLVKGWSHFATFGRAYTGGWATRDALYCLREDYDLESEKFKISYLKHESRHFADYARFPALEQADLEYRGKLTELVYARDTAFDLLDHFAASGDRNPAAPHAFANFAVTADLSRVLFGAAAGDAGGFRSVPVERVQAAARELLAAHTARLVAAGADTTRGVIGAP
jgi:hypothetical protein